MDKQNLLQLMKIAANADKNVPVAFSWNGKEYNATDVNDTLRKELNDLSGTFALFRENKNLIFELIEQTIDDILPKKVLKQYEQFAEVKTFAQGDKPVFTQRITEFSKRRAKRFITKVGLAGIYEVFKLDGKNFEVPTSAFGGAAQIAYEEFLDGRITMSDVLDIVLEGLDEAIYLEIERAMSALYASVPLSNRATDTTFVESKMDKLLSIADSYGEGKATIYCSYEFATTMVPSAGWVSPEHMNERWANGYLGNYKGHRVIVLEQSYEDGVNGPNSVPTISTQDAIIIAGSRKPVKIAFEGQTIVRDIENADMSKEIQIYKKLGVAIDVVNDICVYRNTAL